MLSYKQAATRKSIIGNSDIYPCIFMLVVSALSLSKCLLSNVNVSLQNRFHFKHSADIQFPNAVFKITFILIYTLAPLLRSTWWRILTLVYCINLRQHQTDGAGSRLDGVYLKYYSIDGAISWRNLKRAIQPPTPRQMATILTRRKKNQCTCANQYCAFRRESIVRAPKRD